ncbi:MAG: metal-dependent phosphohydrolase [Candidatus Pacebacteria bacterium CG10_big_fil_rev_8_21_14_0_10_42_12]|nr:MAG: metal-dependent phosphohydrolase [Candidatus Pacebacteria bacterium CG10_big_fil_rev_8_21_14_0_10_42_12]
MADVWVGIMSQISTKIAKIVKKACKADTNIYGYSAWTHHIKTVAKFSRELAKELGADIEIVELSALLHDYASIVDHKFSSNHHIHGARLARELLEKFNYPEEKILQVEHCILSHRASKEILRETLEAEILASADAMAHFANLDTLFSLAFKVKKLEVGEGREFVMKKLDRSWKKLLPEAKKIVAPQYEAAKVLFGKE